MFCKQCPCKKVFGNCVYCNHENQKYIIDYFMKHNMVKAVGFLGYYRDKFPVKTSPKWCPFKIKE